MLRALGLALVVLVAPTSTSTDLQGSGTDLCRAPELASASVTNTLTVSTWHSDNPQVTSTTVVTVASSWPGASQLRSNPYGQFFRDAAQCFLPVLRSDYRWSNPAVSESKGEVTFTDTVGESLDPFAWGNDPSGTSYIGPWNVWPTGTTVRLALVGLPYASRALWTVNVDTGGLTVAQSEVRPTSDDGNGKLSWARLSAASAGRIAVDVAGPTRLATYRVLGHWPAKTVTEAFWSLGSVVLFIPALLLARRWRRRKEAMDASERWRSAALRRLGVVGLVSGVYKVVDDLDNDTPTFGPAENFLNHLFYPGWVIHPDTDMQVRMEVLVLLGASAWLYLSTWRHGRRSRLLSLSVVVVCFIAAGVEIGSYLWSGTHAPILTYYNNFARLHLTPGGVRVLVLSAAPMGLIVYLALAGTIGFVYRLWPVDRKGEPRSSEPTRDAFIRAQTIALAGTVLILALAVHLSRSDWQHYSVMGNDTGIGQMNWIVWKILYLPSSFANEFRTLLLFPIAAGLIAVIHSLRDEGRGVFFAKSKQRIELSALVLLFAGWSEGTFGETSTLQLPIAFTVSYLVLRKGAVTFDLEKLEDAVAISRRNGRSAASELVGFQSVLIASAARIEQLEKELAKIDQEGGEASATEARRAQIVDEIEGLRTGWDRPVAGLSREPAKAKWWRRLGGPALEQAAPRESIRSPQPIDPGQTALSLGPAGTWWENGVQAVQAAIVPIAIAWAYFDYRAWRNGAYWPMDYRFGVLDMIESEIFTGTGWIALAFVLGCLFPYLRGRTGLYKGVVIGLVGAAGLIADAVPTYILGGTRADQAVLNALVTIAFGGVVGFLTDGRTLKRHNRALGRVAGLYRLTNARVATSYAITILLTVVGIWQQAHISDQLTQQQDQLFTSFLEKQQSRLGH